MQKILSENEALELKAISKYAEKINAELKAIGLQEVRTNLIYQVIGGHHSNTDIELAGKRVLKNYQALMV